MTNPEFYCSKNKKASIDNTTDAFITNSTDYWKLSLIVNTWFAVGKSFTSLKA